MRAADAIVVGGGLAGLTAAVGCAEHGLRPIVLEAGEILGGRARSWTDPTTGDPVHIGPHIFLSIYPNMFRLLDALGTREKIVWQSGREFLTMVDGRREIPMKSAPLPAPMHFVPSVLADPTTTLRDVVSNVPVSAFVLRLTPEEILAYDSMSAHDFLRAAGVAERYIQSFWSFTAMAIMNVPLRECSAAALLRFYQVLTGVKGYRIGFPDGGLGDLYAEQAAARIRDAGGEVRTGTRVRRLLGDARRVTGVELDDGRRIEGSPVVAALPPHALASLLPREWEGVAPFTHLDAFQPCPYVSVYLWFDRKLTRRPFWARVFRPDDLNCDFYDYSNILSGAANRPSFITSNIIYADRIGKMSDGEIVAATVAEIAEYLPEAAAARLVHWQVNRIPMAIHCPRPGTESLRPDVATPVDGFYVAGDWTRTGLPSSMESACCSGWMVAERILAARGVDVRLHHSDWKLSSFSRYAARALDGVIGTVSRRHRVPRARAQTRRSES